MRKIFFIAGIIIMLPMTRVFGQQDPQFTQYMFNTLYYNPAYAGVEGLTRFTLVHRTQWLGFTTSFDGSGGNPQTQVLSATTPLLKINSGLGVHLVNDNLGPLNNIEMQVSFAHQIALSSGKLSIGVRAGAYAKTFNYDKHRWLDPNDPLRKEGKDTQVRPDVAAGIYYQADKYYIGVSALHLIKSEFDFGIADQRNPLEKHYYLTGGYKYELNYNLVLTPSVLVKTDFKSTSFDISAIATYDEKIWGGLSFRQSEAAIFIIGYNMLKDKSLRVGYAMDYIIQNQDAKQPTSHEITLSYTLPVAVYGGKKIIRTPRFRY